ncbi:hypothetical protein VTN00DRAFT_7091 [Thermoascus crustaceus]|uniref:uncharacterized protein n=1 Tax=Thermoascus crustaceus TaxID=5088 RepID=UPI003743B861
MLWNRYYRACTAAYVSCHEYPLPRSKAGVWTFPESATRPDHSILNRAFISATAFALGFASFELKIQHCDLYTSLMGKCFPDLLDHKTKLPNSTYFWVIGKLIHTQSTEQSPNSLIYG